VLKATAQGANREIGFRVSRRRDELQMTREQLAEKCGVSSNTIYAIESGKSEPRASTIQSLCVALKCSSEYLLNGSAIQHNEDLYEQMLQMVKNADHLLTEKKLAVFISQSQSLISSLASL